MDFLQMSHLWVLVIGLAVVLVIEALGRSVRYERMLLLVPLVFVCALVFLILGSQESPPSAGLFTTDVVTRICIFIFLLFLFLGSINIYRERTIEDLREVVPFQLLLGALGTIFLSTNHIVGYFLSLPPLFLLVFASPRLTRKEASSDHFVAGMFWISGLLLLLAVIVITLHSYHMPLEWTQFQKEMLSAPKGREDVLCWSLIALPSCLLLFLGMSPVLTVNFEKSGKWSLLSQFKWFALLLAGLSILRWAYWVMELPPYRNVRELLLIGASIVGLVTTIWALTTRRLSVWCGWVFVQPVLISWVGLAAGHRNTLLLSMIELLLVAVAMPYLIRWFIDNELPTPVTLSEASEIVRKSNTTQRVLFLLLILWLTPFGSLSAVEILVAPVTMQIQEHLILAMRLSLGLFFLPVLFFVTQILTIRTGYRPSRSPSLGQKLFSYSSLAVLIMLGLYPWPLYNYLVLLFQDQRLW